MFATFVHRNFRFGPLSRASYAAATLNATKFVTTKFVTRAGSSEVAGFYYKLAESLALLVLTEALRFLAWGTHGPSKRVTAPITGFVHHAVQNLQRNEIPLSKLFDVLNK